MSERVTIDAARAMELLREVVAEYGTDYVYEKVRLDGTSHCSYQFKGACSCLIGHVLNRAGLPIEQLAEMDADFTDTSIDMIHLDWLDISRHARRVLSAAQLSQDNGETWGVALTRAEEAYCDVHGC